MDHKATGWNYGVYLSDSGFGQGADSCKHRGERLGTVKLRGISWLYEKLLTSDEM
jgi:hypothetical protein